MMTINELKEQLKGKLPRILKREIGPSGNALGNGGRTICTRYCVENNIEEMGKYAGMKVTKIPEKVRILCARLAFDALFKDNAGSPEAGKHAPQGSDDDADGRPEQMKSNGNGNGSGSSSSDGNGNGNGDQKQDGKDKNQDKNGNGEAQGGQGQQGGDQKQGNGEAQQKQGQGKQGEQGNGSGNGQQQQSSGSSDGNGKNEGDQQQQEQEQQQQDGNGEGDGDGMPPEQQDEEEDLPLDDEIISWLEDGVAVYVYGPAGCGKSYAAEQAASKMGLQFLQTSCVTAEYKIEGYSDAQGVFRSSAFFKAFTEGGLFLLDEMDASIPAVLTILNQALANGCYDFPPPIGNRRMHPDFHVVATGNTSGAGATTEYTSRNQMDAATLNRFAFIKHTYDPSVEIECANGNIELVAFCRGVRKAAKDAGIQMCMSYRNIIHMAKAVAKGKLPMKKIIFGEVVKGMSADDVTALIQNIPSDVKNQCQRYIKALELYTKED